MKPELATRPLGTTVFSISPIGIGAWAIGGPDWKYGWGAQDDAASIAAIHRALDYGINWIDTAAAYGFGHSEEVVARALTGMRERPYVFTKCGLVPSGERDGGTREDLSRASIVRECEASLRRLRVETLDLYQIHWPTDALRDIDEGWGALDELARAGKIRYAGVSNFNVDEMQRAERIRRIDTLQPPYSLVRRDAREALFPYCRARDIGVIVYSPMYSGLLSGAMTKERAASLPGDDWRSRDPEFAAPKLDANLALVDRLRAVAARHGCSPGEAAIAWTLREPAVAGAIVGARSAQQVDGIIGAAALPLEADDIADLE